MKLILTAIGATALAATLMLRHQTEAAPVDDAPILVVAGREPAVVATPPLALAETQGTLPSAPAVAVPVADTADEEAVSLDTTRSDEPFAAQQRNPEWAGHVESLVDGMLPRGGSITCAAYMCKASVPLPSTDTAASAANAGNDINGADERAVLATQNWPTEIAYNRQTAHIVRGPGGSSLTFLVTRNQWPDEE